MTDPVIPLTGTDLEIWRRLDAGHNPAHIAHVGWYRRAWTPADIDRVAMHRLQRPVDPPPPTLTPVAEGSDVVLPPRLSAALELIRVGASDRDIAARMKVQPDTAKRYRERIATALGVPVAQVRRAAERVHIVEGKAS